MPRHSTNVRKLLIVRDFQLRDMRFSANRTRDSAADVAGVRIHQ